MMYLSDKSRDVESLSLSEQELVNLHVPSGNRWMDPNIGKWISEDPIGFSGGDANKYRYVGNKSTISTDSQGLIEDDNLYAVDFLNIGAEFRKAYLSENWNDPNSAQYYIADLYEFYKRLIMHNYKVAAIPLLAFLNQKVTELDLSSYSHKVSNDYHFKRLAKSYFGKIAEQHAEHGKVVTYQIPARAFNGDPVKSPSAFNIDWVPDNFVGEEAAKHKSVEAGKNEELFFAFGGARIGHKAGTMTIDGTKTTITRTAPITQTTCYTWEVASIDMELWDSFSFPDIGARRFFVAYEAGVLLQNYHGFKPFTTRMNWKDSFAGKGTLVDFGKPEDRYRFA